MAENLDSFNHEHKETRQQLEREILEKAGVLLKRDHSTAYDLINFDSFPIPEPVSNIDHEQFEPDAKFDVRQQSPYLEKTGPFWKRKTIYHPPLLLLTLHLRPKQRKVGEGIVYTLNFPEGQNPHVIIYTEVTPQTFWVLNSNNQKAFDFRILRRGSPERADLRLFDDILDMLIITDPQHTDH